MTMKSRNVDITVRMAVAVIFTAIVISCEDSGTSAPGNGYEPVGITKSDTDDTDNVNGGTDTVDETLYSVSDQGESYAISGMFGGYNGRSSEGPRWTDDNFTSMVNWMSPSSIRYPGGTLANSWDWRAGGIMGKKIKNPYFISDLAAGLPAHTSIVYVMNMVHPTPATGYDYTSTDTRLLQSREVLDAKIDDALDALAEFRKYGRMPVAIELGNELYFNKEEHYGIYTANPTRYIQDAKIIAGRLKSVYPDLKVILCTSKSGEKSTSNREVWNTAVFSALESDLDLRSLVDGVVQHHYIEASIGSQAPLVNMSEWEDVIDAGSKYASTVQRDYDRIPSYLKLWITEYGLAEAGNSNCGRWITGLQYAAMAMGWIPWADKVETIQLQHITLSPGVLNSDKNKLSSVGVVYGALLSSMKGATKATRLSLAIRHSTGIVPVYDDDATRASLDSPHDRIYGWKFENKTGQTGAVLINPTRYTFRNISLGTLAQNGHKIVVYDSPTPTANDMTIGNGINRTQYDHSVSTISIPPFSFIVLE